MTIQEEAKTIAESFLEFYYKQYHQPQGTRGNSLSALYAEDSHMTFEGVLCVGTENIKNKLNTLAFNRIDHVITTYDCQALDNGSNIEIFVIGRLKTDDDPPHAFSQNFQLVRNQTGNFHIKSEVFRMVLHNSL